MVKIGVLGATGRMGTAILCFLEGHPTCQVTSAGTSPNNPLLGQDISHLTRSKTSAGICLTAVEEEVFKTADVVIDFTVPQITKRHLELASYFNRSLVVGTTGLTFSEIQALKQAGEGIALLHAVNMSLGITLLCTMLKKAATILDSSYDVEISETHHRHKRDAPSGTALALAKAVATGRGVPLEQVSCYQRHGPVGIRPYGEIGFSVQRGGGVVGDHTVRFISEEEVIEFSHRGLSRSLFARGAVQAAQWLFGQPPGFYTMEDVLTI